MTRILSLCLMFVMMFTLPIGSGFAATKYTFTNLKEAQGIYVINGGDYRKFVVGDKTVSIHSRIPRTFKFEGVRSGRNENVFKITKAALSKDKTSVTYNFEDAEEEYVYTIKKTGKDSYSFTGTINNISYSEKMKSNAKINKFKNDAEMDKFLATDKGMIAILAKENRIAAEIDASLKKEREDDYKKEKAEKDALESKAKENYIYNLSNLPDGNFRNNSNEVGKTNIFLFEGMVYTYGNADGTVTMREDDFTSLYSFSVTGMELIEKDGNMGYLLKGYLGKDGQSYVHTMEFIFNKEGQLVDVSVSNKQEAPIIEFKNKIFIKE